MSYNLLKSTEDMNLENTTDASISDILSLSNLTLNEQILELTKRSTIINEELNEQISENYGALLQRVTHAGRFDTSLCALSTSSERITSAGNKVKQEIDKQYELLENSCKVLQRLQQLSNLMISAKSLLILTGKLKNCKDVVKQAEFYYEMDELLDDPHLKQVELLQNARVYTINSRQKLHSLTQMQLVTGLQEKNEEHVLQALRIFLKFNTLATASDNLITTFVSDLEQSLKATFAGNDITVLHKIDVSHLNAVKNSQNIVLRGPGKAPQLTSTQNFRARFWKSLHWLIYNELFEYCTQIQLCNKALQKVRQQFNFNANAVGTKESISTKFWISVQNLFKTSIIECPVHISQILQEGLCKLLGSVRGFEERLNNKYTFDSNIFKILEAGYVSKCTANMKACFSAVDSITNTTIDNFIRISSTELSAALVDSQLCEAISRVFIACSKDLSTKLESKLSLGPDAKQVIDVPNFQQVQNILLANLLFYLKDTTKRMLDDLSEQFIRISSPTRDGILKSLDNIDLLIYCILQPLVDSIISTISIIILSVHREPGISSNRICITGPSMYMKELQEFIYRVWHNHILCFEDKIIKAKCGHKIAKKCISYFIHNIIILRPISPMGRQRLKNDCSHMENALKPLCQNLFNLGNTARLLTAISFLIIQTPSELMAQSIDVDSLVPPYMILLMMFGHANANLQSPHETLNWSNERFVEWLEGHTYEKEKLELISGALQRYRDNVRRKKIEHYDPIYPIMVEFLERIYKNAHVINEENV